jgi:lipopolysaccharide/colanic/teichoic acid biosynthesis glycosyltransferase
MSDRDGQFYRSSLDTYSAYYTAGGQNDFDPVVDDVAYLATMMKNVPFEFLSAAMRFKRIFDVAAGMVAMLLFSPVVVIAAVLIKLESRGPVFFIQERIGLNRRFGDRRISYRRVHSDRRRSADRRKDIKPGRPFYIYKLRTMRIDAEVSGPTLASEDDPRITKMGKLLRKTRIDEIPQFLNVIKGDMSIIGPRPERSFFINQIKHDVPEFPLRLRVKPGITGLAQVEHGYTTTIDRMKDKLFYDLKYILELSIFQEILILVKTVSVVLTGKGAC